MNRQSAIKLSSFILALLLCMATLLALVTVVPTTAYAATINQSYVGEYNGNYYDNINTSLDGLELRAEVASLITSTHHTNPTYSGSSANSLATLFEKADLDIETGKLVEFYTGNLTNGFTGNREHVWPKQAGDAFPEKSEAGSDGHHLRPCDNSVNSTRGNKSFGETKANVVNNSNGTCYYGGDFFYPGEGFRGQTARILMYVQTRWGDKYNLKFVLGDGHSKTIGDIETLFKWHLEEPPTANEIYRNNAVASHQGNRNPFIDHPEYAAMIYCYDGESYNDELLNVLKNSDDPYHNLNQIDPTNITLSNTSLALTVGDTQQLSVTVQPSNAVDDVVWSTSNSAVATVTNGKVTAVGNGTATITATSAQSPSISASATVVVNSITNVQISGTLSKTVYMSGERVDYTGVTALAIYSDGTTKDITQTVRWETDDGSTNVTKDSTSVGFDFGGKTYTAGQITVIFEVGIVLEGTPNKTVYEKNQNFDPTGLVVKLMFSDGSTQSIPHSSCKWLDKDTNSSTITSDTTHIVCKYQNFTSQPIPIVVDYNVENVTIFENALSAVTSATDLQTKFGAIKEALNVYNGLTTQEKQAVSTSYQVLQQEIESYNTQANKNNQDIHSAVQTVIISLSKAVVALFALLALLGIYFK